MTTCRAILTVFLLSPCCLLAQELNFANYKNASANVNPALVATGDHLELAFIHRTQETGHDLKVKTSYLSLIYPMLIRESGKRWGGIGISVFDDQSENNSLFRFRGANLNLGYNFRLKENQYVSIGGQLGYLQKQLQLANLSTGSQWNNTTGYDPSVSNGENLGNESVAFANLSAGLIWYTTDQYGKKSYAGFSVYNFNQPNQSFFETGDTRPLRYTALGGARVWQNEKFTVTPEVLFVRESYQNYYSLGSNVTYFFENENPFDVLNTGSIDLNIRGVINESLILSLHFNQPNYSVGFSYDMGLTTAETAPTRKATEFLIVVRKNLGGRKKEKIQVVQKNSISELREFFTEQPTHGELQKIEPEAGEENSVGSVDNDVRFQITRNFNFPFNEYELDEEAKQYLEELIIFLKDNEHMSIEVVGHTDNVGKPSNNMKVSRLRAQAVVDHLIDQGISKKRLRATGRADKEPLFPNDSDENRARNRRVEFIIYQKL